MDNKKLITILMAIIGITLLLLILALKLSTHTKHAKNIQVKNKVQGNFLISSYQFFVQFFLTKNYILKIRSRLEMLELSDNWTINKRTMSFAYVTLGVSTVLFIIVLMLDQRLYFIIIGLLTIYIVHNQVFRLLVEKIDDKLLYQFEKFLGDIRHHYHEHGMIDEAIYDAIEESPYEIALHAGRMYEVLSSEDVESALAGYYDLVPNKYFKTFLALGYTVQKFGDQPIDGKSMFLSNLNYLKQEINLELLRRRKINYLFKSLSVIAITPIFFLSAIENWAKINLPELRIYYEGAYGFVTQIILFILVILCYELINKMQSHQEEGAGVRNKLEERLLRVKWVEKAIHHLVNKDYSKAMRYEETLKTTGEKCSLECFYIKRLLFAVIGLVVSFTIFINIHGITKRNILYTSPAILTESSAVSKESEENIVDFDRKYVLNYSKQKLTYQELEKVVSQDKSINKKMVASTTSRILKKVEAYDRQYFKWWELVLCLISATVFYNSPYLLLLFRKTIVQMNMEDEVMQFHTIILMLMHIERVSVEDLLDWMSIFAVTFKESINRCLNNFEHGDIQALEQLKSDEPFVPFVRIVENLQAATDLISISQAFDELKIERSYYQEKRKQDNEMIVNKKGTWGKLIAFVPLTSTLLLYLITPFIHLSITQFMNYSEQLKNYL